MHGGDGGVVADAAELRTCGSCNVVLDLSLRFFDCSIGVEWREILMQCDTALRLQCGPQLGINRRQGNGEKSNSPAI